MKMERTYKKKKLVCKEGISSEHGMFLSIFAERPSTLIIPTGLYSHSGNFVGKTETLHSCFVIITDKKYELLLNILLH